ncbi:hypothetical protein ACOMHN_066701 [Nucella lapillus]
MPSSQSYSMAESSTDSSAGALGDGDTYSLISDSSTDTTATSLAANDCGSCQDLESECSGHDGRDMPGMVEGNNVEELFGVQMEYRQGKSPRWPAVQLPLTSGNVSRMAGRELSGCCEVCHHGENCGLDSRGS